MQVISSQPNVRTYGNHSIDRLKAPECTYLSPSTGTPTSTGTARQAGALSLDFHNYYTVESLRSEPWTYVCQTPNYSSSSASCGSVACRLYCMAICIQEIRDSGVRASLPASLPWSHRRRVALVDIGPCYLPLCD